MRREDLNTHTSPVAVTWMYFYLFFWSTSFRSPEKWMLDFFLFFREYTYIRECKYARPKRLNDSVGGFFFSTTLWLKLWTRPFYPCHYIGMGRIKDYSPSLSSRLLLSRFRDKKNAERRQLPLFYPFSFKCFKMEVSMGRSLN